MSTRKEIFRRRVTILCAIISSLISCEILARLAISSPSKHEFDPTLGFRYTPNSWYMNAKEGWAYHKTNSIGLMDDELPGRGESTNILVLGDSMVESIQVGKKKNFTYLLEKNYKKTSFINGGHGGFNPSHYSFILDIVQQETNTDFVLLFLHPTEIKSLVEENNVKFIYDNDGNIADILPKPRANDLIKRKLEPLVHRSALVTHFFRKMKPVYFDLKKMISSIKTSNKHNLKKNRGKEIDKNEIIKDMVAKEGANRLKVILEKLKNKSENKLAIIYYENIEYHQGLSTKIVNKFNEKQAYIKASEELEIPIFNISQNLEDYYHLTHQPPVGFNNLNPRKGHLNEAGHKLVASAIKDIIDDNKLIPRIGY